MSLENNETNGSDFIECSNLRTSVLNNIKMKATLVETEAVSLPMIKLDIRYVKTYYFKNFKENKGRLQGGKERNS